MSATICKKKKKKNTTTTTVQFACKLLFLGRSTEQKLWPIDEETRTPILLGCPRCKLNSKLDFKKKRRGFDGKKPNWTKHSGEPYQATYTNSSAKWDALKNALLSRFSLLFWSYWPKLLQCFFRKVLLQSIFLARIISWRPKRAKKSVGWSVVATSLLGNLGYQTKRKKDLWQKQNCSGAACLQWPHAAELNWDAVMTVARQVRIPNR